MAAATPTQALLSLGEAVGTLATGAEEAEELHLALACCLTTLLRLSARGAPERAQAAAALRLVRGLDQLLRHCEARGHASQVRGARSLHASASLRSRVPSCAPGRASPTPRAFRPPHPTETL